MYSNLNKILRRQTELVGKISKGDATEEEKKELKELVTALEALTDSSKVDVGRTKLTTMTLADFKQYAEKETREAGLDPKRLALLKRNIESVKEQAVTDKDAVVAVEVATEKTDRDKLNALEGKMDEILDAIKSINFDGRTRTGVDDKDEDKDDDKKDEDDTNKDGDKKDDDKKDEDDDEKDGDDDKKDGDDDERDGDDDEKDDDEKDGDDDEEDKDQKSKASKLFGGQDMSPSLTIDEAYKTAKSRSNR